MCFAHYLTWTFQLMVVSSVSPNSYSWYVMALFPIVMALLPVFSPVFCFQKYGAAHPSWCLFNCALQNFTNLLDSWICGRLRVFCGRFADFCRRFAGNFGRSFVHLYALVLGIWEWDAARMQATFSHIQNVNCGDSVATRKQKQAN